MRDSGQQGNLSPPHFTAPVITLPTRALGDKAKGKGERAPIVLVVFTLFFLILCTFKRVNTGYKRKKTSNRN